MPIDVSSMERLCSLAAFLTIRLPWRMSTPDNCAVVSEYLSAKTRSPDIVEHEARLDKSAALLIVIVGAEHEFLFAKEAN